METITRRMFGIYAIGDVINTAQLAHVASKEGEIAVEHMAGLNPRKTGSYEHTQRRILEPQIASFGYSEWRAKMDSLNMKGKLSVSGSGEVCSREQPEGMVKVLFDPKQKRF